MLQVVHDVAPGASLAFYTAENGEADFAAGIGKLAAAVSAGGAGAQVIADDLGYFDEPFFQDGIVAQAIDAVEATGVAYFSAAGNDGTLAYDNTAPRFPTLSNSAPNSGEYLLNFDPSGATAATALTVNIPALIPGEFVAVVAEWDQPYVTGAPNSGGATSRIDLCLTGVSGNDITYNENLTAVACTGPNSTGQDPVQIMIIGNPANATDREHRGRAGWRHRGTRAHQDSHRGERRGNYGRCVSEQHFECHAAGTSRRRGCGCSRRCIFLRDAGLRHYPRAARDFLVRRWRTDFIRCLRRSPRNSGGASETGFRGS